MHQYLVQHDVVADGNSIDQTQLVSKTPCVRAALFHEVRHTIRSEFLQRGPRRETARTTRGFWDVVRWRTNRVPTVVADEICCGKPHRCAMNCGPSAEDIARIVWDVQPLVPVHSPRIGEFNAVNKVARRGGRSSPQTKGSINGRPCAVSARDFTRGAQIIATTSASLKTNNRR